MSTREIIGQQMHLQGKKQNAMSTRETIEHLVYLWNVQLQNFIKLWVKVHCMSVPAVASYGIHIV